MRRSGSGETAGHEAGHGGVDEGLAGLAEALVVLAEASAVPQPGEGALNGLITNDKFCLTRQVSLSLRWRTSASGPWLSTAPQKLLMG